MNKLIWPVLVVLATLSANPSHAQDVSPVPAATATASMQPVEKIAPYVARFGRTRPIIAVVGENRGTVLPDYVIPYGVLARSGVAHVVSLATQTGPLKMSPLQINPDSSVAEFDKQYPEGADYVVVPAVKEHEDPTLIAWIIEQAGKGATMVSICNGSLVLAHAGLTRGHRATGHWSTHKSRIRKHPETQWLKNTRYVADGKIVSSAGITAAIPASLALVEAIGGTARAQELATELGVANWGPQHDSEAFRLTFGDGLAAAANTFFRAKQDVGVPISPGVDEIALALTAEAYTATLRGRVFALAESLAPVKTRGGLMVVPHRVAGQGEPLDLVLPEWDATPSGQVPDKVIKDIAMRYGAAEARFVYLEWEYPWQGL